MAADRTSTDHGATTAALVREPVKNDDKYHEPRRRKMVWQSLLTDPTRSNERIAKESGCGEGLVCLMRRLYAASQKGVLPRDVDPITIPLSLLKRFPWVRRVDEVTQLPKQNPRRRSGPKPTLTHLAMTLLETEGHTTKATELAKKHGFSTRTTHAAGVKLRLRDALIAQGKRKEAEGVSGLSGRQALTIAREMGLRAGLPRWRPPKTCFTVYGPWKSGVFWAFGHDVIAGDKKLFYLGVRDTSARGEAEARTVNLEKITRFLLKLQERPQAEFATVEEMRFPLWADNEAHLKDLAGRAGVPVESAKTYFRRIGHHGRPGRNPETVKREELVLQYRTEHPDSTWYEVSDHVKAHACHCTYALAHVTYWRLTGKRKPGADLPTAQGAAAVVPQAQAETPPAVTDTPTPLAPLPAPGTAPKKPTDRVLGVPLMRVAGLLNSDSEDARKAVKSWHNSRKLPKPVGWKDRREAIYQPSAILVFLEEINEPLKGTKAAFKKALETCIITGTEEKPSE